MGRLKAVLGLAVVAFILSGCGGGSGSSPSASAASASTPPTSVSSSGSGSGSGSTSGSGSGSTSGSGTGTSPITGTATLSWQAPTANTNGSALTGLAGYHIYYGNAPGSMTNEIVVSNPSTLSYVVTNLSTGTWYFGVVAYTNTGLESSMSNVGSKTIS